MARDGHEESGKSVRVFVVYLHILYVEIIYRGMCKMKKIVVLATGGTIAGSGAEGQVENYSAGEVDITTILKSVKGVSDIADIEGVQVFNVASDDLTTAHLVTLAREINTRAADPTVAGFVVTHGTNTMDETAYFLNLTVKTDKPVVLTGSMRPSTAISADGPINLYQAVAVANHPSSTGRGVMVVFASSIYGARAVQKQSTYAVSAFGGRDIGALGYVRDAVPHFYAKAERPHTTRSEFDIEKVEKLPKVGILFAHQGADVELVDFMAGRHDGVIIAGVGSGCYSEAWQERVEKCDIPFVRASRVANGPIARDDYYDKSKNVLTSDDLPPQKARILLILALSVTKNVDRIKEIFARY